MKIKVIFLIFFSMIIEYITSRKRLRTKTVRYTAVEGAFAKISFGGYGYKAMFLLSKENNLFDTKGCMTSYMIINTHIAKVEKIIIKTTKEDDGIYPKKFSSHHVYKIRLCLPHMRIDTDTRVDVIYKKEDLWFVLYFKDKTRTDKFRKNYGYIKDAIKFMDLTTYYDYNYKPILKAIREKIRDNPNTEPDTQSSNELKLVPKYEVDTYHAKEGVNVNVILDSDEDINL
jgi:hypothetical protein